MRMKTLTKKAADMNLKELASYIDYSVLKPEFTPEEIIDLTKDGVKLECATICINPGYMELCNPYVQGTNTMLCPVVDFPFGTSSTKSRLEQIADVVVQLIVIIIGVLLYLPFVKVNDRIMEKQLSEESEN